MERMIPAEEGKKLAEEWKAIFLETSAKQNAVSIVIISLNDNLNKTLPYLQSVSDIFHVLLMEIEKADGNMSEKSNCIIS